MVCVSVCLCRLVSLGWPLVVEEVLTYLSTVIAVAMVGQLGAFQLSAFALARSVTNITGISFLVRRGGSTGGGRARRAVAG